MSKVFISHAAVDKDYADAFVDSVLIRGAGLGAADIFYSSGDDTGVKSGNDLMADVRAQAASTILLVALITPTFQTRPVCIAELGAAWAREILFPLMAPTLQRSELEGILPGLAIRSAGDTSTLNELAERLKNLGVDINHQSWGVGLEKWRSFLRKNPNAVKSSETMTPGQIALLKNELEAARAALDEEETRTSELSNMVEALKKAKNAAEVRRITLPKDEVQRFEVILEDASRALRSIDAIVREAMWFDISEDGMPWPNYMEDPDAFRSAESAQLDGTLVRNSLERLVPNAEFPKVAAARTAVDRLRTFLKSPSAEFEEWFLSEYEVPMKLSNRACWRALFS